MKKLNFIFTLFSISMLFTSCTNLEPNFIDSFDKFVNSVEDSDSLTDEEYLRIEAKFDEFTNLYFNNYQNEMESIDKSKVLKLIARYNMAIAPYRIKNIGRDLNNKAEKRTSELLLFINGI